MWISKAITLILVDNSSSEDEVGPSTYRDLFSHSVFQGDEASLKWLLASHYHTSLEL